MLTAFCSKSSARAVLPCSSSIQASVRTSWTPPTRTSNSPKTSCFSADPSTRGPTFRPRSARMEVSRAATSETVSSTTPPASRDRSRLSQAAWRRHRGIRGFSKAAHGAIQSALPPAPSWTSSTCTWRRSATRTSIFAPEQPGVDPREPVRVAQAELIRRALEDRPRLRSTTTSRETSTTSSSARRCAPFVARTASTWWKPSSQTNASTTTTADNFRC